MSQVTSWVTVFHTNPLGRDFTTRTLTCLIIVFTFMVLCYVPSGDIDLFHSVEVKYSGSGLYTHDISPCLRSRTSGTESQRPSFVWNPLRILEKIRWFRDKSHVTFFTLFIPCTLVDQGPQNWSDDIENGLEGITWLLTTTLWLINLINSCLVESPGYIVHVH